MSSKQQDYTEYTVDLSQLTKERPLGVTGILRCQNSADFLDACIESCIEGLDELIAVYHNCTDETANILKRKQSKYPYKIKIFEYQPYIYPIDLTDEQFQETMNLPKDSIHLLSGYTNYAISKVTYRLSLIQISYFFPNHSKNIVMPTAPSKKSGSTLWNKLLISYIHLTCIILKRTKVQKENGKTG